MVQLTDIQLHSKAPSASNNLIRDFVPSAPNEWLTLGGKAPELITLNDAAPNQPSTALQNRIGYTSQVFNSDPIPIHPSKNYALEFSVRQKGAIDGLSYLAVAWYDENGALLVAQVAMRMSCRGTLETSNPPCSPRM